MMGIVYVHYLLEQNCVERIARLALQAISPF